MTGTFTGRIALTEGDEVDVDLELSSERLRLATPSVEIGTWPLGACHIAPGDPGMFELRVDGDSVPFVPHEPEAFGSAVSELFSSARLMERIRSAAAAPPIDPPQEALSEEVTDPVSVPEPEEKARSLADEEEGLAPVPLALVADDEVADGISDEAPEEGDSTAEPGSGLSIPEDVDWTAEPGSGLSTPEDVDWTAEPGSGLSTPEEEDSTAEPMPWGYLSVPEKEAAPPLGLALVVGDEVSDGYPVAGSRPWDDLSTTEEEEEEEEEEEGSPSLPLALVLGEPVSEESTPTAPGRGDEVDPHTDITFLGRARLAVVSANAGDDDEQVGEPSVRDMFGRRHLTAERDSEEDAEPETSEDEESSEPRGRFSGSSLERLRSAVGALKAGSASGPADEVDGERTSVADEILASQRGLREHMSIQKFTPAALKKLGLGAAGLVVLGALGWSSVVLVSNLGEESSPTTTEVATPVTTAAATPTTAQPPPTTLLPDGGVEPVGATGTTVFSRPAPEFADAWNDLAEPIAPALVFDTLLVQGAFEHHFTQYLSVRGFVGDTGSVETFTLVVDPTGPGEADRLGLQGLGVAVGVSNPALSGQGRASVLAALGLDVSRPILEGVDGEIERDGIRYRLFYDSGATLLELTVQPAD